MVYLDELLPSHRKILLAGSLIGDANGGQCFALGLFVSAIGYARVHLTDGIVPDAYLLGLAKSRNAIEALRRAGLIKRVRGLQWAIHDYHDWNKTAEQVVHDRGLNKTRQQRWRAKKRGESVPGDGVTPPSTPRDVTLRNAAVTSAPDPRSPVRTSEGTLYAPTPEVLPTEGSRASIARARSAVTPSVPAGQVAATTLVRSPLAVRSYAYPNEVVGVPTFCHDRYVQRLTNAGVDRQTAERQLLDWYDAVCRQYRGQRIGDREADFWDQRFEEWQGRTPKVPTTSTGSVAARNAAFLRQRQERSS